MGNCFSSDSTPSDRRPQQHSHRQTSSQSTDNSQNSQSQNQSQRTRNAVNDQQDKETKELRVLMLGLDNSGKTTVLYKLKLGTTEKTVPTVGFNVETIKYKNLLINAWDVGGQERLRALWRHYFSGTDILVFVVDTADLSRLEKAKNEMYKVLADKELKNCEIVILANKQDLDEAVKPKQLIEQFDLNSLSSHQWKIIPTVATNGTGLPELLDWISSKYEE